MVSRTTIGSSFDGVLRYQFAGPEDKPTDKKAEVLDACGVRDYCVKSMIADFNRSRSLRPGLNKVVWHTSLSFNPKDEAKLDNEKMLAVALDYIKAMGLEHTQYVIVRHHDRPGHNHLHIVASRIAIAPSPTGPVLTVVKDGGNFYRSKIALTRIIQDHGLTPPHKLSPIKPALKK
jgi:hypothetical protein